MSDRRLRGFERAAAGGDPLERARWLREQVRAGSIAEQDLALAAYLGDPAAALVATAVGSSAGLRGWVWGLARFGGTHLAVRAGVALARVVQHGWRAAFPTDDRPLVALATAASWAAEPRVATAHEAQRAARRAYGAAELALSAGRPDVAACAESAARAALAVGIAPHLAWLHTRGAATRALASGAAPEEALRAALRAALLPPALRR